MDTIAGTEKRDLEQIEPGDFVAYHAASGWDRIPLRIAKVDSVTKTQIVIGSKRFSKETGNEHSRLTYRDCIFPLGAQERANFGSPRGTYARVVEIEQAEEADRQERYKFAKFISDLSRRDLAENHSAATLKQAAELLGYK